jgi:hypothetical protein
MLDNSQGFTRAGVVRINDSVRAYAWAILGAQAQTRSSIIGTGPAFDAQKQFTVNIEAKINAADDLSKSILQYQEVQQYARSKLDYVVGGSLYMVPSDMNLRVGTIVGYNNKIVVATDDMGLGTNDRVNNDKLSPMGVQAGTLTDSKGNASSKASDQHEDTKTAITMVAVTVGLAYVFLYC